MRISDWGSDVCSSDLEFALSAILVGESSLDELRTRSTRAVARPPVQPAARRKISSLDTWSCRLRDLLGVRTGRRCGSEGMASVNSAPLGIRSHELVDLTAHEVTQHERDFNQAMRSEEHTSELQSLMRNSYAVF